MLGRLGGALWKLKQVQIYLYRSGAVKTAILAPARVDTRVIGTDHLDVRPTGGLADTDPFGHFPGITIDIDSRQPEAGELIQRPGRR